MRKRTLLLATALTTGLLTALPVTPATAAPAKYADDFNGDGHRDYAAFPRRREHEFSVVTRQRGGAVHERDLVGQSVRFTAHGRCTPIIASRVTSDASSSSPRRSVPTGRSGITR